MDMVVNKNDIWLINLDPTVGSEIKKTRPCVVISSNISNKYLDNIVVIPLTSTIKSYPSRVDCLFQEKLGQIAIDQIRTIDKKRLIKNIGVIDEITYERVYECLIIYFK
jgi:mRNA interferase MazF